MSTASLGQLTVDLVANTAGFERGMTQAERALKSATKEADRQAQSLDKLIGQIDPTVAAYSRLDKMEMQLQAHRKAGRLPTEDYNLYLAKLNETRLAVERTDKAVVASTRGLNAQGLTAKQLAANLRGVPAQFTDIATSLAAGQNPLTVFLQQGGQLKDMFGGIGPAAKALGGYVVGLINPFTVAAAAAGVLALAYKQGSDEATAFQKAIILTGNAAGTSTSRLAEAAAAIDQVSGTQANAAAALALITETGKFTEDQILKIGLAAVVFERETGQAVSATVDQFKRLAEEPAKASAALNQQYNYLTASVYAQIAALEAQGDAAGAAELAINTYADAMKSRADQINENLGVIEGAWRRVKSGAAEAWDEMLGVGRPKTIGEELADVRAALNKAPDPAASLGTIVANAAVLGPLGAIKAAWDEITPSIQASTDAGREQLRQEEARLKGLLDMESERAKAAAEDAKNNKASIKAQEELNKSLLAGRTNAEKLAEAYKLIDKRVAAAALTGVKYTDAQVQSLRAAAAKQFAEPKGPKPKAAPVYREDAGMRMLDTLRQQAAALQLQSETSEKLGAQAQALARFQQEIADIKSKAIQTADQKALLASEDLITAQLKRNVAIEQEIAARKQAADEASKLAAFEENQASKLASAQEALNSQLAGIGQGEKLREQLKTDLAIRKEYQTEVDKLNKQLNTGQISEELYASETAILEKNLASRLQSQQDYYARVDEAQGSFFLGASEGWANWAAEAQDYSAQAEEFITGTLDALTEGLAESFVSILDGSKTVQEAFYDLANTIVESVVGALAEIAAQWVVTEALQLLGIGTVTAATVAAEATKTTAVIAGETAKTAAQLTATATTTAASVAATATVTATQTAAAATTLASWLPAALVASIGSFGAAAVVGGAALVAAFALTKGFESGGYTGDGGSSEPAGVVHKGEYVFTKAQTAAIGRDKLEAIARNGYQAGGYVEVPTDLSVTSRGVATAATSAKLERTLSEMGSVDTVSSTRSDRGRTTVNQTIQVTGTVDRRTAAQMALESSNRQRVAQARLG